MSKLTHGRIHDIGTSQLIDSKDWSIRKGSKFSPPRQHYVPCFLDKDVQRGVTEINRANNSKINTLAGFKEDLARKANIAGAIAFSPQSFKALKRKVGWIDPALAAKLAQRKLLKGCDGGKPYEISYVDPPEPWYVGRGKS